MTHREIHVIYFYVHSYNDQVIAKILKICIKKKYYVYIIIYSLCPKLFVKFRKSNFLKEHNLMCCLLSKRILFSNQLSLT